MKIKKGWYALAGVLLVSGCAEMNKNISEISDVIQENLPAVTGVLGGVVAYQACEGKKKALCGAAGAAFGAWAGSQLRKHLNEQDLEQRDAAVNTALASGSSQQWSNSQSGNSGSIQIKPAERKQKTHKVKVLRDRVDVVPPMEAVGEHYRFIKSGRVRSGPGTDYKILLTETKGKTVDVVGKVKGKPWYFIGQNNVGTGYTHASLLKAVPLSEHVSTEEAETPIPDSQLATNTVEMSTECVSMEESISVKAGQSETRTSILCRGPNGWEKV